jgi:hypothetical protein
MHVVGSNHDVGLDARAVGEGHSTDDASTSVRSSSSAAAKAARPKQRHRDGRRAVDRPRTVERLQSEIKIWAPGSSPMARIWIRCGGPFGAGHGQTAESIRAVLDEGRQAGRLRKDLDTRAAAFLLQDCFIGALCRWAATDTDALEQHLQPARPRHTRTPPLNGGAEARAVPPSGYAPTCRAGWP